MTSTDTSVSKVKTRPLGEKLLKERYVRGYGYLADKRTITVAFMCP